MALEAVVFPQALFTYISKDVYPISLSGLCGFDDFKVGAHEYDRDGEASDLLDQNQSSIISSDFRSASSARDKVSESACAEMSARHKRRRAKASKNKEEIENQRMTHIVVERNRRKQMNEYLAVLKSLMPPSYIQKGDQASIVGGAINFVKELEQLLHSLEAEKRISKEPEPNFSAPFADFFVFPQYSSSTSAKPTNETVSENQLLVADIEVTMAESHANLKVLTKWRPKQLLKLVAGFQNLCLTILHLNVNSVIDRVLYSFSVKVENSSELSSIDAIAAAVHQLLVRIEEESS